MTTKPDFEALFRASPYPYLLMDTALTIIGANEAYLQSTGRTAEELIGRYVFDAFPVNPDDPDSTNIEEVRGSLQRAIETGQTDTTPFLRYAVPRRTPQGQIFEERYWSTVHTPILDAEGRVAFIAQNAIDVTGLYSFNHGSQHPSLADSPRTVEGSEHLSRAQMHEAMARVLHDERSHLRNLFNQAPGFIAVLSGEHHVFEMVNEAYYQLVGHRDILGKPVWEALPEVAGQGYEEVLDSVYRSGKAYVGRGMKALVQRRPGDAVTEIYIDALFQPLFGADGSVSGLFVQGHDVTETHQAQLAQRESEERLREGMLAARMFVWDWEIESRRMVFSDNASFVLGRQAQTIDALTESVLPEDMVRVEEARQRAFAEKSGYQVIVRFIRPDTGAMIWLDIRGTVRCDANGKPFAVRGVTLDVTDRMRAEEELRAAHRRKDEFLAMLAHELRNPLAPISAAAQMMKHAQLDAGRLRQASDIIIRQVGHMTELIDDLIDVSRVTRGLITAERKPQDMQRIVADAVEQVGPAVAARRHHLSVQTPARDVAVMGDQKRLVQVLTNLLNNAAKYTPEGGHITLSMEAGPAVVEIAVSDNGIGISAELLPHVFDLFTQGERTADRSLGGLGVGLALVKSLVELHGGRVSAHSAGTGLGSCFRVRLPMLLEPPRAAAAAPAAPLLQAPEKPLRLMIVDDNPDAALMLAMSLEIAGHQVSVEHSSRTALERIRRELPDVCLLDIGLPDMDGNELAQNIRSLPSTSGIVLIAVTGYGQTRDRENALAAGFDHHLVKPVDTDHLATLLGHISAV